MRFGLETIGQIWYPPQQPRTVRPNCFTARSDDGMILSRMIFNTVAVLASLGAFALTSLHAEAPVTQAQVSDPRLQTRTDTAASQWMVVTQIFQGDQHEPSETHHIAFQNGIYYDFPSDLNQVCTVFDLPRSRIVLLDRKRQLQTSVLTEDLIHLAARAEAEVIDATHRQRFGMDAQPTQTGELRFALSYTDTQYDVFGERSPETAMAVQYGRFVDWVCRLNIARPRGVPPFARIKLNALMTGRNVLPRETHVTMTRYVGTERIPATIRLRSTTVVSSEIEEGVIAQIKDAQTMRVVFPDVPWDEYEH